MWFNLERAGWYTKFKRMDEWRTDEVQDSGLCGRKCNVPPPTSICMCFFSVFPLCRFLACYSKSQHAIKDVIREVSWCVRMCVQYAARDGRYVFIGTLIQRKADGHLLNQS